MSDEGDTPQAAAGGQFATETEAHRDRTMESRPRRVVLRHDDTGSYQILMGNRLVQGFCHEFEDITGYSIGMNRQQQVRICIEPIGQQRHAIYADRDGPEVTRVRDTPIDARIRTGDGVGLFNAAHPGNPTVTMTWQDEARRHIHEQMTRLQDMLNLLESV